MRAREIIPPTSHPYVARIDIDPADFHRFERMVGDRREMRVLRVDDGQPDRWTVYLGCASEGVLEQVEHAWG